METRIIENTKPDAIEGHVEGSSFIMDDENLCARRLEDLHPSEGVSLIDKLAAYLRKIDF